MAPLAADDVAPADDVSQDICNPSKHLNVDNIRLTQTELTRVPAQHARHVDEALREAVSRLPFSSA